MCPSSPWDLLEVFWCFSLASHRLQKKVAFRPLQVDPDGVSKCCFIPYIIHGLYGLCCELKFWSLVWWEFDDINGEFVEVWETTLRSYIIIGVALKLYKTAFFRTGTYCKWLGSSFHLHGGWWHQIDDPKLWFSLPQKRFGLHRDVCGRRTFTSSRFVSAGTIFCWKPLGNGKCHKECFCLLLLSCFFLIFISVLLLLFLL